MYLALEQAARSTKKRVHLFQVGWFANDSIEAAFRDGAKQFCPSVNTTFVDGRLPEVRQKIWFAADVFTSLSDNVQETFGLTPLEAMAAGLPVVVSDWDGYRDTVRQGLDGFTVPTVMSPAGTGTDLALRHAMGLDNYDHYIGKAGQLAAVDVGACAEAYTALLSSRELRTKMGEAGRRRAKEVFDWAIIIAAYQELWHELRERRRRTEEVAPRKRGQPAHPLRDDPFAVFRSYPSIHLHGNTVVALREKGVRVDLATLRENPLTSVASSLIATEAQCESLLVHLRTQGACRVSALLQPFPERSARQRILRTLVWLAKVGMVSMSTGD